MIFDKMNMREVESFPPETAIPTLSPNLSISYLEIVFLTFSKMESLKHRAQSDSPLYARKYTVFPPHLHSAFGLVICESKRKTSQDNSDFREANKANS